MSNSKKNINGILLLDKSIGLSSNAALQRVKHLLNAKKAGHTGSLDPLATGMLPICFGEATKFSQFLLESDKHYRVIIKLGITTTTGDAEGEIIAEKPVGEITVSQLETVLKNFTGTLQQIPPMFSAIKHKGKPLYELARKGIEIERAPRTVHIYSLENSDLQHDLLTVDVHCSKGTYVRTLAEDIGNALGCGAHVHNLRRISVTPYQKTTMMTIEAIEQLIREQGFAALDPFLLPIESSVQALPAIKLSVSTAFYLKTGQSVMVPGTQPQGLVRLYSDAGFLGVGEILSDGRLAPRRLVA